jgi:hypothetical protein
MFREKVGGDTEELMKAKGLKHYRDRFDCAISMKLYTPVGDRTDHKHGSTRFNPVCATDRYPIQAGEVKL